MASFLDLSILSYFSAIFPVILVFAVVLAILQKTKALGESMQINAMVAIVASFMVLLSQTVIDIINYMIPWFAITIIFLVMLILIFQMFRMGEKNFLAIVQDKTVYWALIAICLLIFLAAVGNVMGQSVLEQGQNINPPSLNATAVSGTTSSNDFQSNIYRTLFHPKVLGLMIIFGIAIFAVILLSA